MDDARMTTIRLLRDKQQELESVESAFAKSARSMTRLMVSPDDFDINAFEAIVEDLRSQFPQVEALRRQVRELKAGVA